MSSNTKMLNDENYYMLWMKPKKFHFLIILKYKIHQCIHLYIT